MRFLAADGCHIISSTLDQTRPLISQSQAALLKGFSELRTLKNAAGEILNDLGIHGTTQETLDGIMKKFNGLIDCRRRIIRFRPILLLFSASRLLDISLGV